MTATPTTVARASGPRRGHVPGARLAAPVGWPARLLPDAVRRMVPSRAALHLAGSRAPTRLHAAHARAGHRAAALPAGSARPTYLRAAPRCRPPAPTDAAPPPAPTPAVYAVAPDPASTPTPPTPPVEIPSAPVPTPLPAATPVPALQPAAAPPTPPAPAPRVFVSHSSANNGFGLEVERRLVAALGADAVFYDSDGGLVGGDDWLLRLQHQIPTRDFFLQIVSPEAVASRWRRAEFAQPIRQERSIGGG
jgi:hypothetical protein